MRGERGGQKGETELRRRLMVSFLGNVPRLRVWPRQVDRVPKCPQVQDDTSLSVGPIY